MHFENRRPLWSQEERKGKELLLGALLVPSFLEAQSRRDSMPPPCSQRQVTASVNQELGQWLTVSGCGGVIWLCAIWFPSGDCQLLPRLDSWRR